MLWVAVVSSLLSANPYLDEGAALFDRMLYEKAAAKLKRAVEVSASTPAERRRAHDLLARAYVALGQPEEAKRTFTALLSIDARAPLPVDAAPNIRRLFLEAKEQLYPKGRAALRRVAAPLPRLTVELSDPWEQVATVELRRDAAVVRSVAATPLIDLELEQGAYELIALSAAGETLGSMSVEDLPAAPLQAVTVGEPVAAPPRSRWPVVGAGVISVALLAAGAALSVAAASDSGAAGRQHFASDIRAYDDAARDKGVAGVALFGAAAVGGVATAVIWFAW